VGSRPNNLGNIEEVRESAEDLLDNGADDLEKGEDGVCVRCGNPSALDQRCDGGSTRQAVSKHLQRSCTWQYPTETFDDEDPLCSGTKLCGSTDDHKYDYATDNSGDNATESSDGFTKR
jgi:hypothetical protein